MKIRSVGKASRVWGKLKKGIKQGRVLYTVQDKEDARWAEQVLFEAGKIDESDTTLVDAGLVKKDEN